MKCPNCGDKTKVVDTRDSSSPRARIWVNRHIPQTRKNSDLDWRYRKRECVSCKKVSYSIEYIVSDLKKIFKDEENEKKGNFPKH